MCASCAPILARRPAVIMLYWYSQDMPCHYHVAFFWHAISFPLSAFLICSCHTASPLSWYCTTVMLLYHRCCCAIWSCGFSSHAACQPHATLPCIVMLLAAIAHVGHCQITFPLSGILWAFCTQKYFYNYKCYNHSRCCSWLVTLHRYLYHNGHSKDGHSFLWCVKSPTLCNYGNYVSCNYSNYVSYVLITHTCIHLYT